MHNISWRSLYVALLEINLRSVLSLLQPLHQFCWNKDRKWKKIHVHKLEWAMASDDISNCMVSRLTYDCWAGCLGAPNYCTALLLWDGPSEACTRFPLLALVALATACCSGVRYGTDPGFLVFLDLKPISAIRSPQKAIRSKMFATIDSLWFLGRHYKVKLESTFCLYKPDPLSSWAGRASDWSLGKHANCG